MYILGINAYHWDAAACILKDGELIAASEEERFNRVKHWSGFPIEAIRFCLAEANISIEAVDYITVGHDPKAKFLEKGVYALKNTISKEFLMNRLKRSAKIQSFKTLLATAFEVPQNAIKAEIKYIEHHRSHLASAFFTSPFKSSALLSIDGFGDFSSTMLAIGNGTQIKVLESISFPHSLGAFYTAFTQFLGFSKVGDEYKVMGLSPYGKAIYVEQLREVIQKTDAGLFKLNKRFFNYFKHGVKMEMRDDGPFQGRLYSDYMVKCFGEARGEEEELTIYHFDLAASIQVLTEEIIFHIAEHLFEETGLKNLCIAGGCAQNSVANGKMIGETSFEKLFVPPASHDAGTALGSALYFYHHELKQARKDYKHLAYTGFRSDTETIRLDLDDKGINYTIYNEIELVEVVASAIERGDVIGWYQGRAEYGPRALGNRSILVDPRRADAKQLLNNKIKKRESFRPFAPSILAEFVAEYFVQVDEVPYMEKVFDIKKEQQSKIPAVTHVNGTGRLQTVRAIDNPRYYALIERFFQKTGIPVLLNTSFNENEPIVNTPQEALACFLRTKMDMLVLENIVIKRSELSSDAQSL